MTELKYFINKSLQKESILNINFELFKGQLYIQILNSFIKDCIKNFGIKIFSIKKSYNRTLTNILSNWIFYLYIEYDYTGDYFFPTNFSNTSTLENIFRDLCKYDESITDIENKIKIISDNLKFNYKKKINLLLHYKQLNSEYNVKKTEIIIKNIFFYKLILNDLKIFNNYKLLNIINNIFIPCDKYNNLVKMYTGPIDKIDNYLWIILFRYQLLGSNNNQLAVLPTIINKLNINYNLKFECFASTINATCNNYCSIYYDVEKYFGSIGNFFNLIPLEGTYLFNPPYQKDLIDISIHKLFKYLDNNLNLSFIITIPIWDNEGKKLMNMNYNNQNIKNNINYGDFDIINKLKNSKYLKYLKMYPKELFTYIDHNYNLYKNKTIQNTYLIVLSNVNFDITFIEKYDFYY